MITEAHGGRDDDEEEEKEASSGRVLWIDSPIYQNLSLAGGTAEVYHAVNPDNLPVGGPTQLFIKRDRQSYIHFLQRYIVLSLDTRLLIIKGIILGLRAIYRSGYVLRDLKKENILLDEENNPIITDMGAACVADEPNMWIRRSEYVREKGIHNKPNDMTFYGSVGACAF